MIDKTLFWLVVLLCVVGILAVSDASAPQALAVFGDPYYFAKQQIVWVVLGFVGLIIATRIHYSNWKRLAFIVVIVCVVLLVAVLIPGIGSKLLGARRWISFGFFALQPSELAKFAIAVGIARLVDDKYPLHYVIGFIGMICGLVMLQPDLGTTIVIAGVGVAQLFIAGIGITQLITLGALGSLITGFLILVSDYRRARLLTFLESSTDPLGNSYHMRQILIALGSGGIFGVGIGQSRQKHLFLPETASDSIFAVIAEETGLIGSFIVIFLLTFFVLRVMKVARSAPDNFSRVLATGIAFWFMAQTLLNLSSMNAITPLTGIPLPFFSYGGSSLVMILFATGIILNISKHAHRK
ncbi:cell division protein FtsW [Candidatus Woesebacteria bacterium RIFCSPHIGHO2_01_FULL_44_21]|uniref:Probable peptidoglycan glycosyltransferase FtsW n=1 Tax=Candidatus Woesebacteria bacterium RIFCSPHIGHO2_01_FULL_44_21 TaxID=1802503 RepID=A0A1F7Z0T2_9BACT|nr:MAG: cell division protein FtsW [Candidatus Woesebacteria bacterium RIFCSPHIGHO2_01_FULL_44_21]OGM71168.1 MAG: cell division protein FtsW [Candidatus Woesebacteria bacterium RIFCSPLOWO2_01_FULL_44_24b]